MANPHDTDVGDEAAVEAFIERWQGVTASELSTSQTFLIDLCRLLGVATPHPTPEQDYLFERPITFQHGDGRSSAGRIDLYRRGAFVLESKKLKAGSHTRGFDDALLRARSQAEAYARALPAAEGRPPFLIVVDVGQRIELYSEFSRSGATYTPFPDPRSHRIGLADLRRPELRERLRRIWTDPLSLDPSRESARVTRAIAAQLAQLARSLEQAGHAPEAVAQFLMRCLFTMFAEDVRLLPADSFRELLQRHRAQPEVAMRMLAQLWQDMDRGGFSAVLAGDVLQFNGKLFKHPDTLPLDAAQIGLLQDAARADWKHVEPAIFGTLLERALSPQERHQLGAHYTPRAYVERLVLPTVIEPLRREWGEAQAAALTLASEGKEAEAVAELRRFHHRLCAVRVLDPACGSGNFLYVTLEHLKRLEGEVLNALDELGFRQTGLALDGERADALAGETVDPHNLLGIELNPRAAAIAEVVLWIGYLQWHFRTRGDVTPPVPVIRDFRNIENRDAVLAHDGVELVTDARGVPVTRWDGRTYKTSPVTGEDVPDESARIPLERYRNPRPATWPQADFVVGNPPFIGNKRMRTALGDGYVEALRGAWPQVPESADFVMYWWHHAALLTRRGALERFGLITTNSIRQSFNRRVIEPHLADKKQPLSLVFAIPDHPWVDSAGGAAVRIAMTVGRGGSADAVLRKVVDEQEQDDGEIAVVLRASRGHMFADLKIGANVASAQPLRANAWLSNRGVIPHGEGMTVNEDRAVALGLGSVPGLERHLRPYLNGRDVTQTPRALRAIDMHGLTAEQVRERFPAVYQWLLERVKPERDQSRDRDLREKWWLHRRNNEDLRRAIKLLDRYLATVYVSKHRFFVFLPGDVLPDDGLVAIGMNCSYSLGVLSSAIHEAWSLATGSTLEDRPRYNSSICFQSFAFPEIGLADFSHDPAESNSDAVNAKGAEAAKRATVTERISEFGEQLDAHRKRQQAAHPGLTLTGMYNVLEKLRSGEPLTDKERTIHEQGLVSVLRQIHDDLDAAVLDAYGWTDLLPLLRVGHGNDAPPEGQTREDAKRAFDEAILERLVALNAERAAEEARGLVRWLRPEFQNPQAAMAPTQGELPADDDARDDASAAEAAAVIKPQPWPKDAVAQVRAVADLLAASPVALSLDEVGARFTARGPWKKRLPALLDMLVALGRAREHDGRYAGA